MAGGLGLINPCEPSPQDLGGDWIDDELPFEILTHLVDLLQLEHALDDDGGEGGVVRVESRTTCLVFEQAVNPFLPRILSSDDSE